MKVKIMLCGILLLGLSGCRSGESRHFPIETPYVSIDADTLGVDIEGDLGGFVFHRDRYYAFFHQWYEQDGGLHMDSHLYVLTKEGQILHEIPLPNNMELPMSYWMYLKADSLCVVPDREPFDPLYLNEERGQWEVLPDLRVPLYEDEDYVVTSSSSGEWGGTVYFADKKTGDTYEGKSRNTFLVQKIDSAYYVTSYLAHAVGFSEVIKIRNPQEMLPFDTTRDLTGEIEEQSTSLQGLEVLVDTVFIDIVSSFAHKGRLLHIYQDPEGKMQIGEIKEGRLTSVLSLQDLVGYCMLQNIPSDTVQYLSFSTRDYGDPDFPKDNRYGFMMVTPHTIQLHYLR